MVRKIVPIKIDKDSDKKGFANLVKIGEETKHNA